ncbi:hypothetical protein Rsub_06988 [Raphidocelis subcapitata]|uniref:Uncharacterized protein n=1 Tax=Raphidocelis subcapitata TaxID=307507 RepID=A0A2V0P3L4_9CHLO|nr:hypothetical protein Rsub_06988 [Raphidocelis subcapitata]|eukprot:GBF94454.1 hypothetical protein Rsub_06988 [Raphidocelis subcapitata]
MQPFRVPAAATARGPHLRRAPVDVHCHMGPINMRPAVRPLTRPSCAAGAAKALPAQALVAAPAAPGAAARAVRSQQRPRGSTACAALPEAIGAAAGKIGAALSGAAAAAASWPWWALLGAAFFGVFCGLAVAKAAGNLMREEVDPRRATMENAELREKVEELQQLIVKLEPLAYKGMRLRFTKGINKAVILGMVDQMLANKEVNVWWLPDEVERLIYFNIMTLMLSVLDEVVDGMSINFAGHNVKLTLTYLDLEHGEEAASANAKTEALFRKALQPVKPYGAAAAA